MFGLLTYMMWRNVAGNAGLGRIEESHFACEHNADVQHNAHEKKAHSLRSDRKEGRPFIWTLLTSRFFTFYEVDHLISYIKGKLIEHLDNMAFNSIEHDDIQILDACTPMKFSLHVIHRGVVFDNNHRSSCASYVAEFNQFLRDDILRGERRALEATNEMPSTQYIAKT
ncbi:hypothetical protein G6F42_013808 [Rhizopus arrhizus]|nr:hypothetical protein G6F42_013808 [Rhizopus arrhizus]